MRLGRALALLAALVVVAGHPGTAPRAEGRWRVVFHPSQFTVGEVGWIHVLGATDPATVEGAVGGRSLTFFPYAGGQAALVGVDLETKPGAEPWDVAVLEPGHEPWKARGTVRIARRTFHVQRLTLPRHMVDLDPETERRAVSESERLRTLYRTITGERLWRGRFTRPVAGTESGTGFGARRVINGQPRLPHSGIDFPVPRGTPVVAVNSGQVALVGDFFFPGHLVVIDHGLGLYTLYFHLDEVLVQPGEPVDRGQKIGTVGATGRATGPHLHFGAQVGASRIDPAALLKLAFRD
jgi:murein DD-endopeptidase MepM/ murein hydrolase activator NlpD